MSPTSTTPRPAARRRTAARRGAGIGLLAAVGAASLLAPSAASAARVTSLQPWKPTNTYLAKDDIDGRAAPQLEPRARVNHVRKGSWVRISCQTTGQMAYGSRIWDKVGDLYVPDQLLKTYTDGPLRGVPRCGAGAPAPTTPAPAPTPQAPATNALWQVAQNAAFGPRPADASRIVEDTPAETGRDGVVMLRLFIPDSQAGGRLLKGDGRGWNSFPSQSVPSRASLFWDTRTGKVSLTVDPTHISDALPGEFWGLEYRGIPGPIPGGVFWPKKYPVPSGLAGGTTRAALPITNYSSESSVRSTDFKARSNNTAAIYGSSRTDTVYVKMSLLNSVTNSIPIGAWSVDTKITIKRNPSGSFKVHTEGNGYPAVEAYYYPKVAGGSTRTLFLRRIHPWAYDRSIKVGFLPRVGTGTVDPGGGIAALDVASDLSCDSRTDGGSDCDRDGMGANPLPNLIAPDSYGTSASDTAG
ncbi:hypothetical protein [Patulibacter sp.]|uniref:hypothetical protein n=1 Tax=Patulibacter sp. TaxID=1912859 RepID=UPI00271E51C7|nr:hypothetical protein [Patulibacter sp.]MDO9410798.1 hypothetical protein [Patulibacter sp.]